MLNRKLDDIPNLTTERLSLRQLSIHDKQEIFNLRSSSEINKYLDRKANRTIDEAIDFIHRITESISKGDAQYWVINLRESDLFAGTICLFNFSDEKGECEIGYELLTKFQGKGIMKEAVVTVIDFAFNTMQVGTIEAIIHEDNQRSINLVEQLLFIQSDKSDKTNPQLKFYHLTKKSAQDSTQMNQ